VLLIGRIQPPPMRPTGFSEIGLPRGESLPAFLDNLVAVGNTEAREPLAALRASIERIVVVGTSSPATEYSPVPRRPSKVMVPDAVLAALVPRDSPPVFLAPDTLLHPVMTVHRVAVDYDGDGQEALLLDATGSHTHEWGGRVTRYIFEVDGSVQEETECPEDEKNCVRELFPSLSIGEHTSRLTIGDQEGRLLSGEDHVVQVTTIDEVPGCALSLYPADTGKDTVSEWLHSNAGALISDPLHQKEEALRPQWVTASITAAGDGRDPDAPQPYESCRIVPDRADSYLDSQFKEHMIIRAMGTIEILDDGSLDSMKLDVKGGDDVAVWINGKETQLANDTRTIHLSRPDKKDYDKRVSFEVRWLVGEAGSSPDGVRLEVKGKNRWYMTHGQLDWPPFINKVTPDVMSPNGGQEMIIHGVGFLNPKSLKTAKLLLSGRMVKRDEVPDGGRAEAGVLEWSGTQITYRTHQIDETGLSHLQVETSSGISNAYPVKVSAAGQMDDIKYKSPKTLLRGLFSFVDRHAAQQEESRILDRLFDEERSGGEQNTRAEWQKKRDAVVGGFGLRGAWGPDAKTFYVGTADGNLMSVRFTANDEIDPQSLKFHDTIKKQYPDHSLIGIAFDPLRDPSDPHLYVSHAPIYYWWRKGITCFEGENGYAAFMAKISRLTGPDFSVLETVVEGLPNGNSDHNVNGIYFDNDGSLYACSGSATNAGWPNCMLGGLPESPLTGALLKIDVRNPKLTNKIEYVYYKTRELVEKPNQVEGDRYDLADSAVGIFIWASGLRNIYDATYTTKGAPVASRCVGT